MPLEDDNKTTIDEVMDWEEKQNENQPEYEVKEEVENTEIPQQDDEIMFNITENGKPFNGDDAL